MSRIVILGDSLGMPRPEVKLEQTYPYLLQELLPDSHVYTKHRRANDSRLQSGFLHTRDDIEYMQADILIIHLGIVDCAPRLFSRTEQKWLQSLKIINRYIISLMSKRRLFFTKFFPKVYVKTVDYEKNMRGLINAGRKSSKRILIVNIANTSAENLTKSYGFADNIDRYNGVLTSLVNEYKIELVDINSIADKNILADDGIHFNIEGNKLLAHQLDKICRL